jgi:hypothetical protein
LPVTGVFSGTIEPIQPFAGARKQKKDSVVGYITAIGLSVTVCFVGLVRLLFVEARMIPREDAQVAVPGTMAPL